MVGDFPTSQSFGDQGDMVGLKKRRTDLVKQLIEGEAKRMTILLVGPCGSGKTFLVNNVFRSPEMKKNFACKAWVVVPRCYKFEDLLLELLKSCSESTSRKIQDQAGSTGEKLHRYLEGKRHLIVLDDVRNKQDCECIGNFLPSGLRGSRIIVTTRNSDVVDTPAYVHKLDGLIEKETFVAVARLLSRKQQLFIEWNKFLKNIGSEIKSSNDAILFGRILKPGFVDLPVNLKSCFLYFSLFPEGHSITHGRLIHSWIAEGFVKDNKRKTLEEVAEGYLNDLIGRCFVQVGTPEVDGHVKTFKILRLHHEFIVYELYGGTRNLFSVIDESTATSSLEAKFQHISIHYVDVINKLSEIKDPSHVSTLFAFGQQKVSEEDGLFHSMRKKIQGSDDSKFENVFRKFKLLKVLDLQGMPLHEFPKHVDSFILLRRLNLRSTNITTVPRSVKKLILLESLDLKYTRITELPKQIRKLQKLYHILASNVSSGCENGVNINFGIDALPRSLHEVSLIKVKNHGSFIKELGNLVEMRKLGLSDIKQESGSDLCQSIQKMKNLSKL